MNRRGGGRDGPPHGTPAATRPAWSRTLGSLTDQAAGFLDASVPAGLNILVAGVTQAGKTTLLNCLAASIPGRERVVSVREVFELAPEHTIESSCSTSPTELWHLDTVSATARLRHRSARVSDHPSE
jgi:type IV secretory pathway ATPase VirB11/archaellum biosynthesis ATPase